MPKSLRTVLNEANPNKLPSAGQVLPLGEALAFAPRTVRGAVVGDALVLAENAKAAVILQCFVAAGGVTGRFTPVSEDDTPATTQCGISAGGDVVFLAADAVTVAEVTYVPLEGTVFEDLVTVAADIGTLLQGRRAAVLLRAEALTGGAVGVEAIVLRGATPGAGEAAVTLLGTGVEFAAADAVTSARVRYIAQPGTGTTQAVGTVLNADQSAL